LIRRIVPVFVAAVLAQLLMSSVGSAAHPIVPTFERFYWADDSSAEEGGRLLLSELSCTKCHATEEKSLAPKSPPILDQLSGRAKPDWVAAFIQDPQKHKPGTAMPDLFTGLSAEQKKSHAEALTHFLYSIGPGKPEQQVAGIGSKKRGEQLYHTVGCVACHGARLEGSPALPTSMPLPELEAKYTLPGLTNFVRDPHAARPSGRMPGLNLTTNEARDVASYLLPKLPEKAGLAYSYYEGSWTKLPNFSDLKPVESGAVEKIDITPKKRDDNYGLRFEAALTIDTAGEYQFFTRSDDGSRLWINDELIVDNDSVHPPTEKSGKIKLTPGTYLVRVDFFEAGGGDELKVEYLPPGGKRQLLHTALTSAQPSVDELPPITFTPQENLVRQGRALFTSLGCASCHQAKASPEALPAASALMAPALAKLDAAHGCLEQQPVRGLPHYPLSDRQRTAIATAIVNNAKGPAKRQPSEEIHLAMNRFNCYACHGRNDIGGIEQERLEFFQTTQPEMGTEGAIPPGLQQVGAKLTREWLAGILANGAKDRPYMLTRMPKFGADNIGYLAAHFEQADHIDPLPQIAIPRKEARQAGWKMVGEKGFACIKCHTFGPFKATGVQSIDMTVMHKRLREDWFRQYIANPQVYRRGTRMPSAWPPPPNASLLPDILGGDSQTQIQAVWNYLQDGKKARVPQGLYNDSNELQPLGEAIIYRNFIQDVSPRAIAVGYPEATHLAWDADRMALALLWQGAFIDASRHWNGRGQGFQPPLGRSIKHLPSGPPLAILETKDASWPGGAAKEQGFRFQGYTLSDDQRPTFGYTFNEVAVTDFPNPKETPGAAVLDRTLTFNSNKPIENMYCRIAVGPIKSLGEGWYQIDDDFKIRLSGNPLLRGEGASKELLAPVIFTNGKAEITASYTW